MIAATFDGQEREFHVRPGYVVLFERALASEILTDVLLREQAVDAD